VELIGGADIYITPYKHKGQVVSGTLAYALSAGKAIISTPYLHAIELLAITRRACSLDDPQAIAEKRSSIGQLHRASRHEETCVPLFEEHGLGSCGSTIHGEL